MNLVMQVCIVASDFWGSLDNKIAIVYVVV